MPWYTSDELGFLDWLGTGVYTRHSPKPSSELGKDRLLLLDGYKRGMKLRSNWEHLDHKKIEAHLNNLIANIKQSTKQ